MATLQGTVGVQQLGAAANGNIRLDRTGGLVENQMFGKHHEAVYQGLVFVASTASAGIAMQTTITTTANFTLANPANSGKLASILVGSWAYVSGTMGAGDVIYVIHNTAPPITAPSAGTAVTPTNARTDLTTTSGMNVRSGATVPTAGIIARILTSSLPVLASTAVWSSTLVNDLVDGALCVGPGTAISITSVLGAGSSSPVGHFSFTWAEVPI